MVKHFVNFWEDIANNEEAKQRAKRVLKYIRKYKPNSKKILELGVGIGNVLEYFPKKFKLSGLDYDKKYVNICKKKLSGNFYVSSMHNFNINEKFDVIFSIHDSINFLKSFSQWEQTFLRVKKHLNQDGLFILDMYTPKILEIYKNHKAGLSEFSKGFISDRAIIEGNKLTWDFKVFEKQKQKTYLLHKYLMTETICSIEKVRNELKKSFNIIEEIMFDNNKKILFVCQTN